MSSSSCCSYDPTTFILRSTYSLSLSYKIYKSYPDLVCLYVIWTSCPLSQTAQSFTTHLCHPYYRSLKHRHIDIDGPAINFDSGWIGRSVIYLLDLDSLLSDLPLPLYSYLYPYPYVYFGCMTALFRETLRINEK